jgi:hypothetical protein
MGNTLNIAEIKKTYMERLIAPNRTGGEGALPQAIACIMVVK